MDEKLTINEVKVLSALKFKERYGLEIIKTVKEDASTTIFLGTLYNLLSRMKKKGYVESRWGDDSEERGGARRRYYRLTGLGEKVLSSQQEALLNLWRFEGKLGIGLT